jgi:hypothetical protein
MDLGQVTAFDDVVEGSPAHTQIGASLRYGEQGRNDYGIVCQVASPLLLGHRACRIERRKRMNHRAKEPVGGAGCPSSRYVVAEDVRAGL